MRVCLCVFFFIIWRGIFYCTSVSCAHFAQVENILAAVTVVHLWQNEKKKWSWKCISLAAKKELKHWQSEVSHKTCVDKFCTKDSHSQFFFKEKGIIIKRIMHNEPSWFSQRGILSELCWRRCFIYISLFCFRNINAYFIIISHALIFKFLEN